MGKQYRCHGMACRSRVAAVTVFMICLAVMAIAVQQVTIVSPRAKAIVSGIIQILARPLDEGALNYALLVVDKHGHSVSNSNPLRFELDTTQLNNGAHMLQVNVYDSAGAVVSSSPLPIFVLNKPANAFDVPKLTETPSTPHQPASLPVAPKHPPTPVTTPVVASTTPHPATPPIATQPELNVKNHIVIPGTKKKLVLLLDGKPLIMEREPFISNGHTMVLLRPLVAAAGGSLEWKGEQGTAVVEGRQIDFTLGAAQAIVDGKPIVLDQPLIQIAGRVLGPVTVWRALFAGGVGYESQPRCVWLRSPEAIANAKFSE